jgi:hypothetical protein
MERDDRMVPAPRDRPRRRGDLQQGASGAGCGLEQAREVLVASVIWDPGSELHLAQGDAIERLGYRHCFFRFDETIPRGVQVVLMQGPYGSVVHLRRQLVGWSRGQRPTLVWWFQQSFDFRLPAVLQRVVPVGLARMVDWWVSESEGCGRASTGLLPRALLRGRRIQFLGDILWLHDRGILDVLGVSSQYYADFLRTMGLDPLVVPRGYDQRYGRALDLERSIAAVWIGKTRNRRRRDAIYWLRDELARRGLHMEIRDGQLAPFVYGGERTRLLNQTGFVVSVLPEPTSEVSIRYYIAAANGAVVIAEPTPHRYPFKAGEHLLECRLEDMPDTIAAYMQREDERSRLAGRMLHLMETDLTLERSLEALLARANRSMYRSGLPKG